MNKRIAIALVCVVLPGLLQAESTLTDLNKEVTTLEQSSSPDISDTQKDVDNDNVTSEPIDTGDLLDDEGEPILVDQVECVLCGPESTVPFSDTQVTWKRDLNNQFVPLQNQIQQEIVAQHMVSEKIPHDPQAASKHLEMIKAQNNNMSQEELEKFFADYGRTLQEAVQMIHNQYMQEYFTHHTFKSNMVPTQDEIEQYYRNNPETVPAQFTIRIGRVDYQPGTKNEVEQTLAQHLEDIDASGLPINWAEPIVIAQDWLSQDKEFIAHLKVGQVSVQQGDDQFELYQLIAIKPEQLLSLKDRRNAIVDILQRQKLQSMIEKYNNAIKEFIDIIPLTVELESEE